MNVVYIGLGEMGGRMAVHIKKAGYNLIVYNRTLSKAKRFAKKYDCDYVDSIPAACGNGRVIMTCLRNDQVVENVMSQILKYSRPGTTIIDNSTTNYQLAQKLYRKAKKKKINFIDAPVTGAEKGAEKGDLATSVGGDYKAFKKVEKILSTYSSTVTYMGPSGHGQLTKITNLMISFNIKQGLIEGLEFANAFGIDRSKLLRVLLNGSSYSFQAAKHADNFLKNKLKDRIITPLTKKDALIAVENIKKKKLRLQSTELFAKIINK